MQHGEQSRGGGAEEAGIAGEFQDRCGGGLHEQAVDFAHLSSLVGIEWVREALKRSGAETIRRRKLPNEVVVWLVIGIALFREWSIDLVVKHLGIGGKATGSVRTPTGSPVSSAAVAQARRRVGIEPLVELFSISGESWVREFEDLNRWRALSLFGLDGSTLRIPDTAANEEVYGRPGSSRSKAGYPQARLIGVLALGSRILSDFTVGTLEQGEQTLAEMLLGNLPDRSLLDRGFVNYGTFARLARAGTERHFLCRAKKGLRATLVRNLGRGDILVELKVSPRHRREDPSLAASITVRMLDYQIKGFRPSRLFTSLLDSEAYPARELVELYHERWEIELAYDELKTHTLERQEALRSKQPDTILQEICGLLIAYNLVRVLMARAARAAGVDPCRMSYRNSLLEARVFLLSAWAVAPGALPRHYKMLCEELTHLVLPKRRTRRYPRAVKIKMTSYKRKTTN